MSSAANYRWRSMGQPIFASQGHGQIQKFLSKGVQLWRVFLCFFSVFLVDEGRTEDPYNTKRLPSSTCQRSAIYMACRWWPYNECWLGSFVIFRGSGPVLLKETLYFCNFPGGLRTPLPLLDPSMKGTKSTSCAYEMKWT